MAPLVGGIGNYSIDRRVFRDGPQDGRFISMRAPCTQVTLRGTLFFVAIMSAYLAGVVSQRSEIERKWKQLDSVHKALSLESEQAAFVQTLHQTRVTNSADLERVEKLIDQLDAYELIASDSHLPEPEQ